MVWLIGFGFGLFYESVREKERRREKIERKKKKKALTDKGHLGDNCIGLLPADSDLELRAGLGVSFRDVSHRHVLAQAGRERARGDLADARPVGEQDVGVLPWRRAAGDEPDPPHGNAVGELLLDDVAAEEVAGVAPPLADRPRQPCLDGGDVLVEVVAVQAQAGLEAERVARAEAAEADGARVLRAASRQEGLGELDGVGVGHGDLEAVLFLGGLEVVVCFFCCCC